MLTFSRNDRILVLAPHPDDETIATGGILQEAVRLKLPVKVVYYTNGDNNEMSFIVYEKRLVVRQKEFIKMGEMRRKEAVSAMMLLGLKKEDLIFLGYPDFGTMHILREHWKKIYPFKSMLTRVTKVPYPECFSHNAPYSGESILNDLKTIVKSYKPTKIFVSHPADINVDHRSLYIFLRVALWDLSGEIKRPEIYPFIVHATHWPKIKGFYPKLKTELPETLVSTDLKLVKYDLSADQVNKKKDMISCYKSQIEYNPPFLVSFARKSELFGNYPVIKVKEGKSEWDDLCGFSGGIVVDENNINDRHISTIYFQKNKGMLFVKLDLHKLITKERGINISLFGYKKNKSFSLMPKIRLHIGWRNRIVVYDKQDKIFVDKTRLSLANDGKEIMIEFPLKALGNPNYIMTSTKTHVEDLPLEATAWRILELIK